MSDKQNSHLVIPERIQIEGVFACNASCIMCPVHAPSERKKGVMKLELFKEIIDKLEPYKEKINKVDLWGLGESLMDKKLHLKIKYAKEKGFKGLAIATNVELLDEETAIKLFEAGLDTIIFSIDGIKKETHEGIREDLNFDRVRENAERAIALRDKGGYATRFVVRLYARSAIMMSGKRIVSIGLHVFLKIKKILLFVTMYTYGVVKLRTWERLKKCQKFQLKFHATIYLTA